MNPMDTSWNLQENLLESPPGSLLKSIKPTT